MFDTNYNNGFGNTSYHNNVGSRAQQGPIRKDPRNGGPYKQYLSNHDRPTIENIFMSRMEPVENGLNRRKQDSTTKVGFDQTKLSTSHANYQNDDGTIPSYNALESPSRYSGAKNNASLSNKEPAPNFNSFSNVAVQKNSQLSSRTDNELNDLVAVYGNTTTEKILFFSGTVERLIKWHKIFVNHFCYFEVIATVVSIQEGGVRMQKIMLLRDKNKGPILQVIYYATTHMAINDFYLGQTLRCVGSMIGPNIFRAFSIRCASQDELDTLQRLCCICDRGISQFLNI